MRKIEIHRDIRRASTLPGWAYSDKEFYRCCVENVFLRSWQWVPGAGQVRVPGQYLPFTLLEGCLDEPLLLSRGQDDQLRCLSNVCTHRGNLLVEHGGIGQHLRCRYHGRRFSLDGQFQQMPECQDAVDFPSKDDNLRCISLGHWDKLSFVSIDPAVPFDTLIEPIRSRLSWFPVGELRFDPSRSRDYLVEANWALYCDNYLEGFHIPYVHQELSDTLDYGSYSSELFSHSNLQLGVAKDGEEVFDLPRSSPDYGRPIAAYYFWLLPNTMLNFYPWGLSVNVVKPLSSVRTKVSFLTYLWREEKLGQGAGAGLDRVEREDEAVVEAVQRGVRSRLYDRGRYSPSREQGVHHFHRLLTSEVSGMRSMRS